MAVRNLLVVSGNVQGVGYRTLVKQIANRLRVTGMVRNLPDGNVEIYSQCSDKETFDKFIKQIEIKATTDNIFAVHVDTVKSYKEGESNYGEPDTIFETFKIDYGRELDQFQKESLERSEIGILLLGGTISGICDVRSEVGGTRTDIKAMHTDLKEETKKTHENLVNVSGKLENIDGRLGDALERYDVFGQKMISIETEMKEFTKQITRLVDHLVQSKIQEK